jgi:cytochrome c biogenesis factor
MNFIPSLLSYSFKKSILYILVALYLGSWWALQEGSWGGWWNWDASEFLGLLVLYLILTIFHATVNLRSTVIFNNSMHLSLSYLFIFFLLLQLNFNIISHNFGFRTLKFLNTEVLLFSFLSCFLINYSYVKYSEQKLWIIVSSYYQLVITRWLILYSCLLAFNCVVLLSLLSFFFKTLLNLKFFFGVLNFNKLLICLFIFIFIYILNSSIYLILTLCVLLPQVYCILFASLPLYITLRNFLLHYSLYILLLSGLFYKYSTLNDQLYTNTMETLNHTLSLTLNNRELEVLLNFITNTTSFEGKSFDLITNLNYISQVYFLNGNNWYMTVTTIDNLPTILNSVLMLSLTSLIYHFSKRYNFS